MNGTIRDAAINAMDGDQLYLELHRHPIFDFNSYANVSAGHQRGRAYEIIAEAKIAFAWDATYVRRIGVGAGPNSQIFDLNVSFGSAGHLAVSAGAFANYDPYVPPQAGHANDNRGRNAWQPVAGAATHRRAP